MNMFKTILKFGEKHFGACKDFTNENVEDMFLHQIHPKQIVTFFNADPFMFYETEYEYTTIRGNHKNAKKYFIFNTCSPEIDIKEKLFDYVKTFNKENPKRQLLNVKFLRSRCLGYIKC